MQKYIRVLVPATTANCGPGFDCLGMACTLYNEVTVKAHYGQSGLVMCVQGEGEAFISKGKDNLFYKALQCVFSMAGEPIPALEIVMTNRIPLSRGLGSSAAAIASGLAAANALLQNSVLNDQQLLALATEMEGHPDNVAPALFGGVTVSIMDGQNPYTQQLPIEIPLRMVVAIPDFHLATKKAREVLPQTVPLQDAVYNVSRAAWLVAKLVVGDAESLGLGFGDRLHQPYRQPLIPGMEGVLAAARREGALGAVLSGAGPCLMAFATEKEEAIGEAMVEAFAKANITSHYLILDLDHQGCQVEELPL